MLHNLDPAPDAVGYYPGALGNGDTTRRGLGDGQWRGPRANRDNVAGSMDHHFRWSHRLKSVLIWENTESAHFLMFVAGEWRPSVSQPTADHSRRRDPS